MTPEMREWYEKALKKQEEKESAQGLTVWRRDVFEKPIEYLCDWGTCYYCGQMYHPMMHYTKDHQGIRACNNCTDKTKKDGWEPRPDLTPSR